MLESMLFDEKRLSFKLVVYWVEPGSPHSKLAPLCPKPHDTGCHFRHKSLSDTMINAIFCAGLRTNFNVHQTYFQNILT